MPYATPIDVEVRYKPLLTMIGSGQTQVTSTEINSVFIYDAAGIVDSYIGVKYVTPLPDIVPPIITHVTADIAIFNLVAEKLGTVPEFMDKRYNRAMVILALLRDGKMVLPSSLAISSLGDDFAWSPNALYHPLFDSTLPFLDQVPDSIRQSDQAALREGDVGGGGLINECL